jgi:hypothetical protein
MKTVTEQQSISLTLDFKDERGLHMVPYEGYYRLYDKASKTLLIGTTKFVPVTYTYTIIIDPANNSIIDSERDIEEKVLTGYVMYGTGRKASFSYTYTVRNLEFYPI